MTIVDDPTLWVQPEELAARLRLPPGTDETGLAQACRVAQDRVTERCGDMIDPALPPNVVLEATRIEAGVIFSRHKTPEGVLGVNGFGPVRIQPLDATAEDLLTRHLDHTGFA